MKIALTAGGSGATGYGAAERKELVALPGALIGLLGSGLLLFFPPEEKEVASAAFDAADKKWTVMNSAVVDYGRLHEINETLAAHARKRMLNAVTACSAGLPDVVEATTHAYSGKWINIKLSSCIDMRESGSGGIDGMVLVEDQRISFVGKQDSEGYIVTFRAQDDDIEAGKFQLRGDVLHVEAGDEKYSFSKATEEQCSEVLRRRERDQPPEPEVPDAPAPELPESPEPEAPPPEPHDAPRPESP